MNLPAQNRWPIIGLAIAAIVLIVVGIVLVGDHPKRGLLAFALAIACGIGAWFVTRRAAQTG